MDAPKQHVARNVDRPPLRRVLRMWFALLGSALAWAMHFSVNYTLVSLQCVTDWFGARIGGVTVLTWLILLVTIIALGVTIFAGMTARREWHEATAERGADDGYRVTLTRGGLLLSGLFVVLIVFETLPIFFLRPCG